MDVSSEIMHYFKSPLRKFANNPPALWDDIKGIHPALANITLKRLFSKAGFDTTTESTRRLVKIIIFALE